MAKTERQPESRADKGPVHGDVEASPQSVDKVAPTSVRRLLPDISAAPKTGERAAGQLARHIIENRIPPGEGLPSEKEMADQLGIGRGTTREALRLLETFGLVDIRTGRYGGPVVSRPTAKDLSRSLTLAFYADGASMLDVLDARIAMEPTLATMAARRMTPLELEALRETVEAIRRDVNSPENYYLQCETFHNAVAQASGSPVLGLVSAALQRIADGGMVGITYGSAQRVATASAHEEIIAAFERRDEQLAGKAMEAHLRDVGAYWRRHYPEAASGPVEWDLGV